MKKFISFTAAAVLMLSFAAYTAAAEERAVTGTSSGESVYVEYRLSDCEWAVINGYADGKLAMSCKSKKTESGFVFDLPENNGDMKMRVAYSNGEIYPFSVVTAAEAPAPEASAAPEKEETALPSATEETKEKYPEVYEKPLDAFHAPAVVSDCETAMIDGEMYYVLTLLYMGEEITVNVRDTVVINSAPFALQELEGQSPSLLKSGDVIHFLCDLMGRVKTIDLMYRPEFESYVGNGEEFGGLYNYDGYSKYYFGVPIEAKKGYVLLAGDDGKVKEVDINPSVLVYTVEQGGKKPLCEFTGKGCNAISKTYIHKTNLDDDGNVISWADVEDETYALVRTVSDEATDIIVFVR